VSDAELEMFGCSRLSLLGNLWTRCSTNNLSEHIVEHTDMPSHLVKTVSGQEVFEQTQPRVCAAVYLSVSLSVSRHIPKLHIHFNILWRTGNVPLRTLFSVEALVIILLEMHMRKYADNSLFLQLYIW